MPTCGHDFLNLVRQTVRLEYVHERVPAAIGQLVLAPPVPVQPVGKLRVVLDRLEGLVALLKVPDAGRK